MTILIKDPDQRAKIRARWSVKLAKVSAVISAVGTLAGVMGVFNPLPVWVPLAVLTVFAVLTVAATYFHQDSDGNLK